MNKEPQIEIIDIKLLKSVFNLNENFVPSEEPTSLGISLRNNGEFQEGDDTAFFKQRFVTLESGSEPFFLEVEFGAVFALSRAILPIERNHYVRYVFPRLLFPYMRDYVAETTKWSGLTPLLLSDEIFDDLEKEQHSDQRGENWRFYNKWMH